MIRKFRCPKCGEIFTGRLDHCPKCGVELHYLQENQTKKTEDVETNSNKEVFHYNDDNVLKNGTGEFDFSQNKTSSQQNSVPGPMEVTKTVQVIPEKYKNLTNDFIINAEESSYFDGKLIQQIGYNILATLLTLITGTLGLPWAMCIKYRRECKHTVINGKRLRFDGKGAQLFGRYLLRLLLTIITLFIFTFRLNLNLKKWKIKHTVFESVYNLDK